MKLIDKLMEIQKKKALEGCPYDFEELKDYICPEFSEQCSLEDCSRCWEMEVVENG